MPNWVSNRIYVKNTGPEFKNLIDVFTGSKGPFERICPMPAKLKKDIDDMSLFIEKCGLKNRRKKYYLTKINHCIDKLNTIGLKIPKVVKKEPSLSDIFDDRTEKYTPSFRSQFYSWLEQKKEARRMKEFGVKDWYDWRCLNWGTKWDASDLQVIHSGEDEFCVEFETAWSEPVGIYNKLAKDYPSISLLIFAWSLESNFINCAAYLPKEGWILEELGAAFDDDFKPINAKPSDKFLDIAKQFNTPIPGWVMGLKIEVDELSEVSTSEIKNYIRGSI